MKIRVLDQVHISSLGPNSLRRGDEIEVSDAMGRELLEKRPELFVVADGAKAEGAAPVNKAEAKPANKRAGGRKSGSK